MKFVPSGEGKESADVCKKIMHRISAGGHITIVSVAHEHVYAQV